jgi:hypothetical protein
LNDPEAARVVGPAVAAPNPYRIGEADPNRQIQVAAPTGRGVSRSRDRRRRRPAYSRRPEEFYWLWIAATATYGVGDIVSTVAFLEYVPTVREANPVVALALDSFGLGGLVALKIAVYLIMLWISVHGAREGDGLLYYFPPVLLTVVGIYLTASNVRLLLLA